MELLFSNGYLGDYLQDQKNKLEREVNAYPPDYILMASEGDLIEYLISKYTLQAPQILEDEIYQHEPQDAKIDVSQDRSRAIFDRDRPFYIQGTAIKISIPFEGGPVLFNINHLRSLTIHRGDILLRRKSNCSMYYLLLIAKLYRERISRPWTPYGSI